MTNDVWANFTTGNVVITTGGTGVLSVQCRGLRAGQKVVIFAWYQVTTGGTTTALTIYLERTPPTVQLAEANPEGLFVAAGGTEQRSIIVSDNALVDDQTYNLGGLSATANSTVLQAGIIVMLAG